MGRDVWEASAAARSIYETADRVLGFELSRLCFEGPEDALRETENAQPAIFTTSLACLAAAVESGLVKERPAYMAGHSLGEYTALVAAGALDLEDGLHLIRERGLLMAEAGRRQPGTMAAILGLSEEAVEQLCRQAGAEVCNFNLPNQTVIGGAKEAVQAALEMARAAGARNAVELRVSGAFHSSLMRPAEAGLQRALQRTIMRDPAVPVVGNSTAAALRTAQQVREELANQVARPVLWHLSVRLMAEAGVTRFIEFGPGRVLTGLARRIAPAAQLVNVSGVQQALETGGARTLPA